MSFGFDFCGLVRQLTEFSGLPVDLAASRALAQYRDNVRFLESLVDLLQARAADFNSALLIGTTGNESRRDLRADYGIEVFPPATADDILSVAAVQNAGPPNQSPSFAYFFQYPSIDRRAGRGHPLGQGRRGLCQHGRNQHGRPSCHRHRGAMGRTPVTTQRRGEHQFPECANTRQCADGWLAGRELSRCRRWFSLGPDQLMGVLRECRSSPIILILG